MKIRKRWFWRNEFDDVGNQCGPDLVSLQVVLFVVFFLLVFIIFVRSINWSRPEWTESCNHYLRQSLSQSRFWSGTEAAGICTVPHLIFKSKDSFLQKSFDFSIFRALQNCRRDIYNLSDYWSQGWGDIAWPKRRQGKDKDKDIGSKWVI